MKMGLKNMGDIHPQGAGLSDVEIHIPLGIDHGAGVLACKDVRTVSDLADEEMFEQHEVSPLRVQCRMTYVVSPVFYHGPLQCPSPGSRAIYCEG